MSDAKLPLGSAVGYDASYDPGLLFPIARAEGRRRLGVAEPLPFQGWDVWNAYVLSWLNTGGKPQVAWGEFRIPATSPAIVESKSFKLYLNSLNQHRLADVAALRTLLQTDLSACVGAPVTAQIHTPARWGPAAFVPPAGRCLDALSVTIDRYLPAPELLTVKAAGSATRQLFSRLLRSRCPVTGQPDWGTLHVRYSGAEIDEAGLLAYIISFREHQDFHEQCVERMFVDILERCAPRRLTLYARYLRRGGLDINPYRSTGAERPGNPRGFLQ
jgi:7-cyano-7-deazaguanine reductase